MTMIRGVPIILKIKEQIGEDEFGCPIYDYKNEIVDNVLITPTTSDDIITTTDLTGKKAVYTLAIPKGDKHDWTDSIVQFFGREWHTIGYPLEGIEANIPLDWNKKVMVECYG